MMFCPTKRRHAHHTFSLQESPTRRWYSISSGRRLHIGLYSLVFVGLHICMGLHTHLLPVLYKCPPNPQGNIPSHLQYQIHLGLLFRSEALLRVRYILPLPRLRSLLRWVLDGFRGQMR